MVQIRDPFPEVAGTRSARCGDPVGRYCCLLFGIGGERLGIGSVAVSGVLSPWKSRAISLMACCGYRAGAASADRRGERATGRKTDSPVVDGGAGGAGSYAGRIRGQHS